MAIANTTVQELLDQLSARRATPGGGAAAALTGAVGASLCSMAVAFTGSKKSTDEELSAVLQSVEAALTDLRERLMALADADAEAYEAWRQARKAGGEDGEVQEALAAAAKVPLTVVKLCRDGLEMVAGLGHRLNPHLLTDAASGAMTLRAAARAAALNVRVNVAGLTDREAAARLESETRDLLGRAEELEGQVTVRCDDSLASAAN